MMLYSSVIFIFNIINKKSQPFNDFKYYEHIIKPLKNNNIIDWSVLKLINPEAHNYQDINNQNDINMDKILQKFIFSRFSNSFINEYLNLDNMFNSINNNFKMV